MAMQASRGQCAFCGRWISKSGMTRHLQSCKQRAEAMNAEAKGSGRLFHLVVEGWDNPEYWMHLEAPGIATLEEIDTLLRATWLECCGHLSAFFIEGVEYSTLIPDFFDVGPLFGPEPKSMDATLNSVLVPGVRFSYEYDFGSTTRLRLRVVSEWKAKVQGRPVAILARNEAPALMCSDCGKLAFEICTECIWEGAGLLCLECAQDHECDESLRLPVVNSPRTGVCAYTGPIETGT
jgi:hypothetical protein